MDALRQSSTVFFKCYENRQLKVHCKFVPKHVHLQLAFSMNSGTEPVTSRAVTVCSQEEPDPSL